MAAKKDAKTAKPKGKPNQTPSKRGGPRPNSGRKTNEVNKLRRDLNTAVDDMITDMTPGLVRNLKRLADGGYERTTETLELATSVMREEPACLVMRREPVRDDQGRPLIDPATGQPVTIEVPAYPDAKPNERVMIPVYPDAKPGKLVTVRRVVEVADCDRQSNEYLLNRRLGKPKQAVELSGPEGGAIPLSTSAALDKVYGEDDDDADDEEVEAADA